MMESIVVREAVEEDYNRIAALMQQLNPADVPLDKSAGKGLFKTILNDANLTVFLAEFDGIPIATCYLNVIPNLTRSGRPYALIDNVVTDSQHLRKGIGTVLLKQVICYAFEQGCYKVMLLTGRDDNIHAFYESCGMDKNSKTAFVKRVL